jgi:heme/copper-type cytochrome/quinol oxidase subunit 2
METNVRFTPTMTSAEFAATEGKEGKEIKVRCAELCGLSHWSMEAPVQIVPANEFTAWLHQEMAKVNPALSKQTTTNRTSN